MSKSENKEATETRIDDSFVSLYQSPLFSLLWSNTVERYLVLESNIKYFLRWMNINFQIRY